MRARSLIALLPVALATVVTTTFTPAAQAEDLYPSQNCQTALPAENLANSYTVMGQLEGYEYAFVDVVQRADAIEVCFRLQHRVSGYNWEGDYFRFPGAVAASAAASVTVDSNFAACTQEVQSGDVDGTPYRVATDADTICVNVGAIGIRVQTTASADAPLVLPDWQSDCCGIYTRAAVWPVGGNESSLCGTPKLGSSYVVTQNSTSFLRRDEPTNSVCFRNERGSRTIGGRVDTFPFALYMYQGMDVSMCTEELFNSNMVPPRYVRISTNPGFSTETDSYLCVQVNGTSLALHRNPATGPAVPTIHFDA